MCSEPNSEHKLSGSHQTEHKLSGSHQKRANLTAPDSSLTPQIQDMKLAFGVVL